MSEQVLNLIIYLFALTLVSERIGNWFKLHNKTLRELKKADKPDTKHIERIMFNISLFCGLLVAFLANANMFNLVYGRQVQTSNLLDLLGVLISEYDTLNYWLFLKAVASSLIGCAITGVFLSFGSKFWHDVLDIIFTLKNFQKGLSNSKLLEIDEIKEILKEVEKDLPAKENKGNV
jgi:hypothetical protein